MAHSTPPILTHSSYPAVDDSSHTDELEQLRYENEKLKKINAVLMRRVEMGWGNHSHAYQSFEDAALLADKVKERTYKLQQTLHRLEESNLQLEHARHEAEKNRLSSDQDRQRLTDAIESISESFVLFDAERKMVLVNSRCREFWHRFNIPFQLGVTTFQQITAASLPLVDHSCKVQKQVSAFPSSITQTIFKLKDGTWIQMSERKTAEDGLVVVYTDITNIKQTEELRYQTAMAEQAQLLKSTLENMTEAVALINENNELQTWNQQFVEFAELGNKDIHRGIKYDALIADTPLYPVLEMLPLAQRDNDGYCETEITLENGIVLLCKSHLIASGGMLNTLTDITDRSHHQRALQESEQRIRLITDAMPALISYVNKDMCYEFVNREFEKWFHRSRSEIISHHLQQVLGQEEFNNLYIYIKRAMLGQSVNFEVEHTLENGSQRISNKTFIPHFDQNQTVVGFFALEQDVTEQRRTAKALKHAYDYMEQRVNQRTKKISEINAQLRKEIEERQLAQISLLEAKREADRANESKSKFLAATSHDLLQPMNSARLFVSALAEQTLKPEAQKLTQSLSYSLENLESLITALVDISKLEAGLIEPVMDDFPAEELLGNLENEFRPQAEAKGLHFRFKNTSQIIHTDGYLLARILRNLLSNAIRYTLDGAILLGTRRRPEGLEIKVCDTGIGIPANKLSDIFQEFNRVDPKQRRHDQGLGLGLAIVDKLSTVMKHRIQVESIEGRGSCFSVLIPYGKPRLPSDLPPAPMIEDRFNSYLEGANLLIIDNDEAICQGMEKLLGGWGINVISAQTLEQLAQPGWLESIKVDVVVADYHLDNKDTGFDALAIIKPVLGEDIPVIMITANYTNALRQEVRSQGYSLLNKPVKPHKMKLALSNLMSQRGKQPD